MPQFLFIFFAAILFISSGLIAGEPSWKVEFNTRFPEKAPNTLPIIAATAIDIDGDDNVYIVDRGQHQVLKYTGEGRLMKPVGGFGRAAAQFDDPRDVDAHATLDVFVADFNNNRVVRFDRNLNFVSSLSSQWPQPFDFGQVISIAISSQYDPFLLENDSKKIIKFSRFAEPTETFGGIYETFGQLLEPEQLALGGSSRLFVSDPGQSAIIVFDYLGSYITQIEHPDLKQPSGLHWGADDRLYAVNQETADVFIFSKNLKYAGRISLSFFMKEVVDIAIRFDRKDNFRLLYALSPEQCYVFEISPVEKK